MDLWDLEVGDRVETVDGDTAEVLDPTQDGEWVHCRYVEGDPDLVGTEDLLSADEIEGTVD
jgi:hypothetical protein